MSLKSSIIFPPSFKYLDVDLCCQVVRSKLQEQGRDHLGVMRYSGVTDCIKQVYKKEGFPGFYRGCATNLLRTTPNAVITFTSYEMINRLMHQLLAP